MNPNKTLLGILTFIPFIGGLIIGIWVGVIILDVISAEASGRGMTESEIWDLFLKDFLSITLISIALSILGFGLTVYYIVLAIKNESLSGGLKVVWILLLFFFAGLAKIIYYFVEVLPDKPIAQERFV